MKLKKDKYSRARGGNSKVIKIACANCKVHLFEYQKDGQGALIRCYLDRILGAELEQDQDFKCSGCGEVIGIKMIYKAETRPAILLLRGKYFRQKD